jgi:putative endonuclease
VRGGWVYILANRYRGTIYAGVTADIHAPIWKHRTDPEGFVAGYKLQRLVLVEDYPTIEEAITREKSLKKWRREWKLDLIESANPNWDDLFETINA